MREFLRRSVADSQRAPTPEEENQFGFLMQEFDRLFGRMNCNLDAAHEAIQEAVSPETEDALRAKVAAELCLDSAVFDRAPS